MQHNILLKLISCMFNRRKWQACWTISGSLLFYCFILAKGKTPDDLTGQWSIIWINPASLKVYLFNIIYANFSTFLLSSPIFMLKYSLMLCYTRSNVAFMIHNTTDGFQILQCFCRGWKRWRKKWNVNICFFAFERNPFYHEDHHI